MVQKQYGEFIGNPLPLSELPMRQWSRLLAQSHGHTFADRPVERPIELDGFIGFPS